MTKLTIRYRVLTLFMGLVSIAIGVVVFSNNTSVSYQQLHWLPISFGLFCFMLIGTIQKLVGYFVFFLISLLQIIRYLLTPVMLVVDYDIPVGAITNSGGEAVIMMVIELFVVLLVYQAVPKQDDFKRRLKPMQLTSINIGVLLAFWVILLLNIEFFDKISFIWSLENYTETVMRGELEQISPFVSIMFPVVRAFTILFVFSYIEGLSIKEKNKLRIMVIIVLANSTIILGVSRFSIIYSSLPLVLLLTYKFPVYRTRIISLTLVLFFFILLVSSIAKFSRGGQNVETSSFFSAYQLNAYFSGVANYAVGIDSYNDNDVGVYNRFEYLISDLTQNIPAISVISDDNYKTATKFNNQIYGSFNSRDQIVPVSISGLFHFSWLFFFVHTFILTSLAFIFEKRAHRSSMLLFFFYVTLALSCATFMMVNIGSITAVLFMNSFFFIPFFKFIQTKKYAR